MKTFRCSLLLFLGLILLSPLQSQAQFKKLRDRIQKKAEQSVERTIEQRIEQRIDRGIDQAIDNMVNSVADDIEASIEGMIFSSEPPPPIELGDNSTGDSNAPFVRYTVATRIKFGGSDPASQILARYGAQEEIVSTSGKKQRTDTGTQTSEIMDADNNLSIHMDHQKNEWWSMTFDEFFASIEQSVQEAEQANDGGTEVDASINDVKVMANETGVTEVVNGVNASQLVLVVEAEYAVTATDPETNEKESARGTSYMVFDMWQSTEISGYQTLADYQMALSESMGTAMSNSGMQNMFSTIQGAPQFQNAYQKAFEKMKPENGLAVRTITHMVHVPEGGAFDLDTVLQSNPSGETSNRRNGATHDYVRAY